MSDDIEFQILTRSLSEQDFARGLVAIDRLRRGLSIAAACLALSALALLMALTNTAAVMITLAVISVIAIEVGRLGLREFRKETQ